MITFAPDEDLNDIVMTTVELKTSIATDLEQMSVEMLESVSRYVRRLRRHARPARPARRADAKETSAKASPKEFGITPGVARLRTGHSWHVTDEELDRLRYEYLMEKYK